MKLYKFLLLALLYLPNCLQALEPPPYAKIFKLIEQQEWVKALTFAANTPDQRVLTKIIRSEQFLRDKTIPNAFMQITRFIEENKRWPQRLELIKRAEHFIDQDTDLQTVMKWFTAHPPLTNTGHKYYAQAAAKYSEDQQQKTRILRMSWIKGKYTAAEQQEFLREHGGLLRSTDHVAKLEHLLWHNQADQAINLMNAISPPRRIIYDLWLKFVQQSPHAEEGFAKLAPSYKRHPGLLYAYLYYKKKQPVSITPEIEELLIHTKNELHHEQRWTKLRIYYTRELIGQHLYHNAYQVISQHHSQSSDLVNEAEWLAGWLSLRFLGKPEQALTHFIRVYNSVSRPVSVAKAAYWIGRTYQAQHRSLEAKKWFDKAAQFGQTFYGQIVQFQQGHKHLTLPKDTSVGQGVLAKLNNDDLYRALKLTTEYGSNDLAVHYIEQAITQLTDPQEIMAVLQMTVNNKKPYLTVSGSRKTSKVFSVKSYPMPYKLKNTWIEVPLIYAIIRNESSFNQYIVLEAAQDRGLMQIIPGTAAETAKSLKLPYDPDRLLSDAYYNIAIGSKHLHDRINYYHGSYILGIASYNAGITNVNKWIRNFGDPRKMRKVEEIVDWLESIPFGFTRGYVQRVTEALQVYRTRSGDTRLLTVSDIKRTKSFFKK